MEDIIEGPCAYVVYELPDNRSSSKKISTCRVGKMDRGIRDTKQSDMHMQMMFMICITTHYTMSDACSSCFCFSLADSQGFYRTDTFQPIELTPVEITRLLIDQLACPSELIKALLERDLQRRGIF